MSAATQDVPAEPEPQPSFGPTPPVAVVLVNWNSWMDSVECLDSVLALAYPDFHVFLVDNNSSDGSLEHIREWCAAPRRQVGWRTHDGVARVTDCTAADPIGLRIADRPAEALPPPPEGCRVTFINSGANLGFAGGCNVGIRAAGLDAFAFVWLLNPDTVVHRDALAALTQRALADSGIGMVGSTIRYYDRPHIVQALGGALMEPGSLITRHIGTGLQIEAQLPVAEVERQMFYVMGASMLVSRRFVQEIGPMQEDYFLYYEEIDWAVRGRRRFRLGYAAGSHVFHKSGAVTSQAGVFSSNLYYRNRIRFVSRFFPERLTRVRLGLAVEMLRHSLRGRWPHARIVAATLWNSPHIAAQVRATAQNAPIQ